MPLYPFRCATCAHEFELFLSFKVSHPPKEVTCPECEAPAPRVWTTAPIILRPVGWNRSPDDPNYWNDLSDRNDRPRSQQ